jgi:hypothetical protein
MVFGHRVLAPGPGTRSKATFFDKALSGRLLKHGLQKLDRSFGVHHPADTGLGKDFGRLFKGLLPPADFFQQGLDQVEGNQAMAAHGGDLGDLRVGKLLPLSPYPQGLVDRVHGQAELLAVLSDMGK